MARLAFLLLCHKDPQAVVAQARRLTAAGDFMAIHFDGNAPDDVYERIRSELAGNPNVAFTERRVRCGWGEWSLVDATIEAARTALDAFPRATHFYLVSGDCMAIKSAEYARALLDARDVDYIESFDFFASDWIKTGMKEDRLIYRHVLNERRHKRMFYALLEAQKRLGLSRRIPGDLQMMIGSQWWCLRRHTLEAVLEFAGARRDVMRFFRTTWIPDETFFQTLVRHLVPGNEIVARSQTFKLFTDYGMPATFYNDHYDMLLGQDFLFARKISPGADQLKERLGDLWASGQTDFRISGEGPNLFRFLTGRGRVGRRFAPRFWEAEATIGRDRELMIVTCKKWHVAKRLVGGIKAATNLPAMDYIFNEESAELPDLGGIEKTLGKRTRHRRALMRMLFDYFQTDRLLLCLDPSDIELMRDFYADRATTKLLEIECRFSDEFLAGHARRIGLAGEQTSAEGMAALLPAVRQEVLHESDAIRDSEFPNFYQIREWSTPEENARALASFLSIPDEAARGIAAMDHLFAD